MLTRPGVKYSGAYAVSLLTFGQRAALVCSSLPYVTIHYNTKLFDTHGIRPQFLCVLVIIVGRFVNAEVPLLFADLVFVFEQGITSPPWLFLFGYVGLRFLQSSGGLSALRDVGHTLFVLSSRRVHLNISLLRFSGPLCCNTRTVVRKMEALLE
jgi:hypothetical protein